MMSLSPFLQPSAPDAKLRHFVTGGKVHHVCVKNNWMNKISDSRSLVLE